MGHWIKHAGYGPDRTTRLFCQGFGHMAEQQVHEARDISEGRKLSSTRNRFSGKRSVDSGCTSDSFVSASESVLPAREEDETDEVSADS